MDSNENKKPKVLVIITQSEMGGAQRFLIQMARGLADVIDFTIATGSDGDGEITKYLPNTTIHTIKSLKRDISPLNDIRSLLEIRDLIVNIKPDSLFLMSSKAGFNGAIANHLVSPKIRPKTIYRIGGWTFNDPGTLIKKLIFLTLEFISAPLKDIIIVNSLHDYNQAKRLFISPLQDLKLIYNGLDITEDVFIPRDTAIKELLNEEYTGKIIGCIANFYETKGLDILIEAIRRVSSGTNFKCIIIGDGHLRSKLENQIRDLNLSDRIILVGKKDNAYRYLKAFDIYIQPSRKEGFSWAILEAMNAGLAIIATRVGSAPEMIEDGINGFIVERNNPEQITDKIQTILSDPDLITNLGKKAQAVAHQKFSEKTMLDEIKTILK